MKTPGRETKIEQEVVDAIAALGNRHRLEILVALADTERELREDGHAMTFTELYEAGDIESTSQFSYHLDRVVGEFVTETTAGYRLTDAGSRLVRAIRSNLYESASTFDDRAIDGTCVFCETDELVATLEHGRFVVRCERCESTLVTDYFPRSQSRDRTPSEIVDSFGYGIWSTVVKLQGGVCPECDGLVDTRGTNHEQGGLSTPLHVSTCRVCGLVITLPTPVLAAFHPAALGFCWKQGISLFSVPIWEFFQYVASGTVRTELTGTDPFAATVEFEFGDDTLALTVDDAGVVEPVELAE